MKKLVSILCILLIGISTSVFAQISDIINTRNEFGGETMMTPFSADNEEYKAGVAKIILYLNGNYKIVKREIIRTDEYNKSSGIMKSISYFDNNEKVIKDEYFYNDNYALKKGIAKDIFYFDSNEKKVKAEAYDMNGLLVKSSQ
ncbi:MAG: hypothetical protein NTV58_08715 [Deltaproteobacteria bacterium]|nr:hypothetical protein [Deltaproteobacteria bacterium]